jgi:hypothetical protein
VVYSDGKSATPSARSYQMNLGVGAGPNSHLLAGRHPTHHCLLQRTVQDVLLYWHQPELPSTMEHGKVEIGAEILLRISREFVKSVEWLLTGEG